MLAHVIIPDAWENFKSLTQTLANKTLELFGTVNIIPWRAGQIFSKFQKKSLASY